MRKNQVGITIQRFGDSAPDGKRQTLHIYADANNTYEALCAAFYEALDAIQAHQPLPDFGRRSSYEGEPDLNKTWDGRDTHVRSD